MCGSASTREPGGCYIINYCLCQECREAPTESVEGHFKSMFRQRLAGELWGLAGSGFPSKPGTLRTQARDRLYGL